MVMLNYNKRKGVRKPREFRWYTRGIQNGRIVILGGFLSEDEAIEAGLKLNGYYETKLLHTVDLDEASRIFRYDLFKETSSEDISQVFKKFKHKVGEDDGRQST